MNPVEDEDYQGAFAIISYAGNAKSSTIEAIRTAREGDFDKASELLASADEDLRSAHSAQTELLTEEARGNPVQVNIILVHAQDHLSNALLVRDLADEFIQLYRRLFGAADLDQPQTEQTKGSVQK